MQLGVPALLWTSHYYQLKDETKTQRKAKPSESLGNRMEAIGQTTQNPLNLGIWAHTLPYCLSQSELGFSYLQPKASHLVDLKAHALDHEITLPPLKSKEEGVIDSPEPP